MKSAAKVFSSLFLTVLLAEILLRFVTLEMVPRYSTHPHYLYQANPTGGEVKCYTRLEIYKKIRFNRMGYRGHEIGPKTKPRIVVYGDSNITALFSREENTFVKQLEKQLFENHMEAEVINAGIVGYGPDQLGLRIRDELETLKPDLVVLNFFTDNDFGDCLRNKIYSLTSDGKLTKRSPVLSFPIRLRFLAAHSRFIRRLMGYGARFKEDPFLKLKIPDLLRLCHEEYQDFQKDAVVRYEYDHYDADIAMEPESESAQLKVRLSKEILGEIQDYLKDRGIPFLLVILPASMDTCKNLKENYTQFKGLYPHYKRTNLTHAITQSALEKGIDFIDLYPAFTPTKAEELYFLEDDHWNDRGQAVAAEAVAKHLLQNWERPGSGGTAAGPFPNRK